MKLIMAVSQYFVLLVLPCIFICYLATNGIFQPLELDKNKSEEKMEYMRNYFFKNFK